MTGANSCDTLIRVLHPPRRVICGRVSFDFGASSGSLSRRWRPVSATKTSSRLTCRVVRRARGSLPGFQVVEQRGDGAVGLADGQAEPVRLGPGREDRGEPGERRRLGRGAVARPTANSTTCSPPIRAIRLRGGAQRDHLALVDDRHPVAEPLGLVHVVRRQDGRPAPVVEVADHLPELPARLGVEARRRLVEEKQFGVADQGDRHGQPLLLAAGKLLDVGIRLAFQRDPRQDLVGVRPSGRSSGRAGPSRGRSACRGTGSPGA